MTEISNEILSGIGSGGGNVSLTSVIGDASTNGNTLEKIEERTIAIEQWKQMATNLLGQESDMNDIINTIYEVYAAFQNTPEGTNLFTQLDQRLKFGLSTQRPAATISNNGYFWLDETGIYQSNSTTWNVIFDTSTTLKNRSNHIGTQSASTIVQDANNRFTTDTEKAVWNAKVSSQWVANGADINYNTGKVGIGTPTPNASSILDLTSTTLGFLPPRMTTAQRDLIPLPASGLVIFNTTTNKLNVYANNTWNAINYANKYSISETDSGEVWIDGKTIFQRTFTGTTLANYSDHTLFTVTGATSIVDYEGFVDQSVTPRRVSITSPYSGVAAHGPMFQFYTPSGGTARIEAHWCNNTGDARWQNNPYTVTVYYVK